MGSMYSPSARLISIHALREEGDPAWATPSTSRANFNPRPPRGGRPGAVFNAISPALFQSTPSARRATRRVQCVRSEDQHFNPRPPRGGRRGDRAVCRHGNANFNPRPPRGGRPGAVGRVVGAFQISIHALREEGDRLTPYLPRHKAKFQSTPSARRATQCHPYRRHSTPISIHALREEGDLLKAQGCKTTVKFQSTPSARRATGDGVVAVQDFLISIHALREEGDMELSRNQFNKKDFNPRPPRGGRHNARNVNTDGTLFQSTPSARRATGLSFRSL